MDTALKIGMAQMFVEPGAPARNLDRAIHMIAAAASQGCTAVVLPECLDCGWTHPSAREFAETIPGKHTDALASAARSQSIYVVAGLAERDAGRIYNAAVLLSPEGEILIHHRKINELDIALDLYSTGTSLRVVPTALGTVGVSICADNFPDSLMFAESMARMGARLLLSPCAWAVDADHDNEKDPYGQLWLDAYVPLARNYDMTVVGVSNVGPITAGPWKGRKCIGCSLAVEPGGAVIARGPYGENAEALVVTEVPSLLNSSASQTT